MKNNRQTKSDTWTRWMRRCFMCVAFAGCIAFSIASGCDDDNNFNHNPPAGQGAIIVDNNTFNDIRVFIDGIEQTLTREDHSRAYDTAPGLRRVVLDETGGDRAWGGDVDVLEGRNTILDVITIPGNQLEYDVAVYFE
ncbi:MAG: hypothetical protein KJ626_11945 [Verrucomicrobia bacterium]|nr:hypothetical protein [Verrucomicrobiota bacterium]